MFNDIHLIRYVILLLACTGGYIDTFGYLLFGGIFTSSITGNLVVACTSVISTYGVLARSLTCVSFLAAIACTSGLLLKLSTLNIFSKTTLMGVGFVIEIAYFIVIWIVGNQIYEDFDEDTILLQWQVILLSCITGASMGVHNAVAKEAIPNCPSTTVMTMTLVSVGQSFAQSFDYYLASNKIISLRPCNLLTCTQDEFDEAATTAYYNSMQTKYNESFGKFIVACKPLLAFIIGALIGSGVTAYSQFTGLIIPIFMVLCICVDAFIKVYVDNKANTEAAAAFNPVAVNSEIEIKDRKSSKL